MPKNELKVNKSNYVYIKYLEYKNDIKKAKVTRYREGLDQNHIVSQIKSENKINHFNEHHIHLNFVEKTKEFDKLLIKNTEIINNQLHSRECIFNTHDSTKESNKLINFTEKKFHELYPKVENISPHREEVKLKDGSKKNISNINDKIENKLFYEELQCLKDIVENSNLKEDLEFYKNKIEK